MSAEAESEVKEEGVKWVGRLAENSRFWGDGRRCQG